MFFDYIVQISYCSVLSVLDYNYRIPIRVGSVEFDPDILRIACGVYFFSGATVNVGTALLPVIPR